VTSETTLRSIHLRERAETMGDRSEVLLDRTQQTVDRTRAIVQARGARQASSTNGHHPPVPALNGSTPSIRKLGLGYRGVWPQQSVMLTLSHMRVDRGDPSGLLTVYLRGEPILSAMRLTLTTPGTRKSLAKDLGEATPGFNGWGQVLDEFARHVVRLESEGEPISWLAPWQGSTDVQYLVDPLLRLNVPTILFGPGGAWKSTLATLLALSVAGGYSLLDWPSRVGRVMVLDWETDQADWEQRATDLCHGFDIDYPRELIGYRRCKSPLYRQVDGLAAWVADQEARLVIVDSVMMASGAGHEGGDPAETAIRLFDALRQIGVTSLLIDHVTGDNVENGVAKHARPYGSVVKENAARATWEMRTQDLPGEFTEIVLKPPKMNRGSRNVAIGLRGWVRPGKITLEHGEVTAPELVARTKSLAERVASLLATEGKLRVSEICDALEGTNGESVRRTLRRSTRFQHLPDGCWGLRA
jgi:hypothetical protein